MLKVTRTTTDYYGNPRVDEFVVFKKLYRPIMACDEVEEFDNTPRHLNLRLKAKAGRAFIANLFYFEEVGDSSKTYEVYALNMPKIIMESTKGIVEGDFVYTPKGGRCTIKMI